LGELLIDILGQEYLDGAADSRRLLVNLCAERGWHCLDATPAFQEAIRAGEPIYYAQDFHLDASGNQVLAQIVNDYIVENQLLPPH